MPSKNPLNHSLMNYLSELGPHLWWTSQPGAWWGKIPILDPPSTWCWSGCPGPQAVWKTTVAKLHRDSQPHTIGSRGYQNVFQGDFWMVNRIYQNVNQPPINQGIVSPLQFLWISVEIKGQKWNPENLVTKKWQVLTHTIRNIQIGQINEASWLQSSLTSHTPSKSHSVYHHDGLNQGSVCLQLVSQITSYTSCLIIMSSGQTYMWNLMPCTN